jgi:peptidoglycan/xylan/chitin deacetylase (PgdA/CDA1 family)
MISGLVLRKAGLVLACMTAVGVPIHDARAADHAAIFMYHRFGESSAPSTNIRLDQFQAHLEELRVGGYRVMPVIDIVEAITNDQALPDKAVGITIDDAFLSAFEEGIPLLKSAGFPVTLFIATDAVDRGSANYMNWEHIRELVAAGVTIGAHSASHGHLATHSRAAIRNEIERANARFKAELGVVPNLFAYPYGEASADFRDELVKAGFRAAFGQHSGVLHTTSDRFFMPRFSLNERYGDLKRVRRLANALPLPIADLTPDDMLVRRAGNPPGYGFTIIGNPRNLKALACYSSSQGQLSLEILGRRRIEVRFASPLKSGRQRVNCTMPGPKGRWHWLGYQFFVASD